MEIERDQNTPGLGILRLNEELSGSDAEALVHEAEAEINRGLRHLVVDCSRVRHISSHGLGVLIRLHHRLRRRGGDLKLVGTDGVMDESLQMTRLHLVFQRFPTLEAAMAPTAA